MAKKELDFNEVLTYLEKFPYNRFKEVVYHYASHTKTNFESELEDMVTLNFQQRLEKLQVNSSCTKCNSGNVVKNGKKKRIQRYKCNDCNSRFTLFTGTVLEKTKWHWDIWIAVLNMTINSFSLKKMENVLEKPSTRYITLLKAETEKIRTSTSNKYFKFDEEDGVKTFNKREYLLDQPKSKLHAICKAHSIKKYRQLALYFFILCHTKII